jgi:hypothetical protein
MSWHCSPRYSTAGRKNSSKKGAAAFQTKARPNHRPELERIDHVEKKIQTKDEVVAELMVEHVA